MDSQVQTDVGQMQANGLDNLIGMNELGRMASFRAVLVFEAIFITSNVVNQDCDVKILLSHSMVTCGMGTDKPNAVLSVLVVILCSLCLWLQVHLHVGIAVLCRLTCSSLPCALSSVEQNTRSPGKNNYMPNPSHYNDDKDLLSLFLSYSIRATLLSLGKYAIM